MENGCSTIQPRRCMARVAYKLVWRPVDAGHGHAALVFDGRCRLHLPLITFVREATRRLSASSVRVYVYALLRFFTFLDSRGPGYDQEPWTGDFEDVGRAVVEYLEEQLGRVMRRHRLGFELVSVTGRTRSNASAFLAALKL
jgi:hypothetical protein